MATLLKQNARAPIVRKGNAVGSVGYSDNAPAYRIDIYPADPKERDYYILLTRAEMLQTMSTWIEKEARDERDKKAAEKKALTS